MADRIAVGKGVVVYRRWRTWWIDVTRDGVRFRHSLKIHDQGGAIMLAGAILNQLQSNHTDIQEEIRFAKVALGLLNHEKGQNLGVRTGVASAVTEVVGKLGALATSNSDLQDLIRNVVRTELHGEAPEPVSVDKAKTEYLTFQKAEGNGEDWVDNVEAQMRLFLEWSKVKYIHEISIDVVQNYKAYLVTELKRGRWSVRQKIAVLHKWLNWAREVKKWIRENPTAGVRTKKPKQMRVDYYSATLVPKILAAAPDRETAAAFAVAVYGGPRREEIFLLDWSDFDFEGRTISIYNRDQKGTKTGVNRKTVILDQLLLYLLALPRTQERVFTQFEHVDSFGDAVLALCKKFTKKDRDGLGDARHTFATWAMRAGCSASVVAEMMGNSVRVIEEHYRGRVPLGEKPLAMTVHSRGPKSGDFDLEKPSGSGLEKSL